jgi:hypothetical protein
LKQFPSADPDPLICRQRADVFDICAGRKTVKTVPGLSRTFFTATGRGVDEKAICPLE